MQKITEVLDANNNNKYTVTVQVTIEIDAETEGDAGYEADSIIEAIPGYQVHSVLEINDGSFEHELESFRLLANKHLGHHIGMNADWIFETWHLGNGEPNKTSGDMYLVLDTEHNTGMVVKRHYGKADLVDLFDVLVNTSPLEALDFAMKMREGV